MRFEHLARFYSQAIFEAWKCRMFAEGLKQELKRVVVPMAITKFPALVEKAKVVERLNGGNRVMKTAEGPAGGRRQGGGATLRCYRNRPVRGAQRGDAQRGDKPTITGRVFALTGAEASTSSDLVKGKVCDLGLRLLVSTPASALVVVFELCGVCSIVVNEKRYKVEEELLISASQAESLLWDGAECCLLLAAMSVETERVIVDIDVVRDFTKVFPDEVPGLPPTREIEFGIDLVPGTGPVSVAPYRMAPVELVELKGSMDVLGVLKEA
ncbi:uncharacterized protein LOC109811728 [Cajanus cajan]|uniref:uncharacterized protein LOC109811728 n=1 Tax=Cajanus cajan TaxID=3821 RepID=UPI00098D9F98|nr:uncharacterized protein LOC109811728 [Cajanus cajan]